MCGAVALPAAAAREDTFQGASESFPEISVEVSVNERVQSGIEVADPEKNSHYHFRAVASFSTNCSYHVPETKLTVTD